MMEAKPCGSIQARALGKDWLPTNCRRRTVAPFRQSRRHSTLECAAKDLDGVQARNEVDSVPGTYWWTDVGESTRVTVEFSTNGSLVVAEANEGQNLLRVAQDCNAIKDNPDFCYDGTCEHCVMEVQGAREVGRRADPQAGEFVRACLTPVPAKDPVSVKILDEDSECLDGWV